MIVVRMKGRRIGKPRHEMIVPKQRGHRSSSDMPKTVLERLYLNDYPGWDIRTWLNDVAG